MVSNYVVFKKSNKCFFLFPIFILESSALWLVKLIISSSQIHHTLISNESINVQKAIPSFGPGPIHTGLFFKRPRSLRTCRVTATSGCRHVRPLFHTIHPPHPVWNLCTLTLLGEEKFEAIYLK